MRTLILLEHRLLMQKVAVRGCASDDKEVFHGAVRYFSPSRKLTMSREPRSRASPLRSWFHHWCWLDWACWCWCFAFHKCGWSQVVENGTVDSTLRIRVPETDSRAIHFGPHTATAPSLAPCPAHSADCMGALDEGLLPTKKRPGVPPAFSFQLKNKSRENQQRTANLRADTQTKKQLSTVRRDPNGNRQMPKHV